MSSINIERAREDMLERNFSLTSSLAPFSATISMSGSTLRDKVWIERLSQPARLSKVNMLSWILSMRSGSIFSSPPMIWASRSVLTKFMILAALLTPPKLELLADELLENCCFMIASSSLIADG